MWQRAQVVETCPGAPPVGFLCWVMCRPPQIVDGASASIDSDGLIGPAQAGYRTNVLTPFPEHVRGGTRIIDEMVVMPSAVELLAEFCDDPPRIPWGSWDDGTPAER